MSFPFRRIRSLLAAASLATITAALAVGSAFVTERVTGPASA